LSLAFDAANPDADSSAFNSDRSRRLSPKGTRCFTQTTDVLRATQIGYRRTCKQTVMSGIEIESVAFEHAHLRSERLRLLIVLGAIGISFLLRSVRVECLRIPWC
jgi:hypothetical protein